jgi:hypothetical protein
MMKTKKWKEKKMRNMKLPPEEERKGMRGNIRNSLLPIS